MQARCNTKEYRGECTNTEHTLVQEPSGALLSLPPFQVLSLWYERLQPINSGCKMCRRGSYCDALCNNSEHTSVVYV